MRTLLFSLLLLCGFTFSSQIFAQDDVTVVNFKGEDITINGKLFFTGYMKGESAMVDLYVQYDTELSLCIVTRVTKPDEFAGKVNDKEIDICIMFLSEIDLSEDVEPIKEDGFYTITMYPKEGNSFTRTAYKRLKAKPVNENAPYVEWIFYNKADADRYAEQLYNYIIEAR
jgi:hypothetical protein